ncbi:MAG: TolC family protein [Desulfuromonas sp.]|nr:MAG: TolC family protein [Desulfuromonas sp.]
MPDNSIHKPVFRFLASVLVLALAACSSGQPPLPTKEMYPFHPGDFDPSIRPVETFIEQAEPTLPITEDNVLEISIEQAIVAALNNNRDLRVQRLGPVIAGTFEQIERGIFDPEVYAEYSYFEEESIETSRSTGTQFSVIGEETEAVAGLRQFVATGTQIDLNVTQSGSESNRAPEQQTARAGLTITQSLLRGFGPAVNLARVRQQEFATKASRDQFRGYAETVLAETEIAYWNHVLAHEEIRIFKESLDVARQQLSEIELRIEVGILPEIELAAARTEEALRVQALIDARSLLEESRLRLLRLLSPGGEKHFDLDVITTSEFRLSTEPLDDLEERLFLAVKLRPDLQEARLRLQQERLETVITRNGLLPRLDLFINYGKTGYADSFSNSFRELDQDNYDLTAGLRLNHFLGNRAARARNEAAFASRQQAAEAVANLQQLVKLDVRLAFNELERARQQIDATRKTRKLQEQTLNAEKERFGVGASTALQVAQVQRDYLQTQIAEVEAMVHYRIALVRLYLAEGSLLDRRGITVGR